MADEDTRKVRSESGAVFEVRDSMLDAPPRADGGPFRARQPIATLDDIKPHADPLSRARRRPSLLRASVVGLAMLFLPILGCLVPLATGCEMTDTVAARWCACGAVLGLLAALALMRAMLRPA